MSSKKIDWSKDASSIRKQLLMLRKTQLVKLCKKKNVSPKESKSEMISALLSGKTSKSNIKYYKSSPIANKPKSRLSPSKSQTKIIKKESPKKISTEKPKASPKRKVSLNSLQEQMASDESERQKWKIGSKVELYSDTRSKWLRGQIIKIFTDNEGEWLTIKYAGFSVKEIQRYNKFVRPIGSKKTKKMKRKKKEKLQEELQDKTSILNSSSKQESACIDDKILSIQNDLDNVIIEDDVMKNLEFNETRGNEENETVEVNRTE